MDNDVILLQSRLEEINRQIQEKLKSDNPEEFHRNLQRSINLQGEINKILKAGTEEYVPADELAHLIFTQERIRIQLEQVKQAAKQAALHRVEPVQIQGTVATRDEAHVQVPEQRGIWSRFGRWIKGIFSKNKPDPSELPRLSKAERELKTTALINDEKRIKNEMVRQQIEAGPLTAEHRKLHKEINTTKKFVKADFNQIKTAFKNAGWINAKLDRADGESDEDFLMRDIQYFLIQVSDRGELDTGENFKLGVDQFSKKEILQMAGNRDHDTVVKILKPVFEFDFKKYANKYPLHKMKNERERFKQSKKMLLDMQKYTQLVQWAEAYALDLLTPEELDRFEMAHSMLTGWTSTVNGIGRDPLIPSVSYWELVGKRVESYDDMISGYAHKNELREIFNQVIANTTERTIDENHEMLRLGLNEFTPLRQALSEEEKNDLRDFDRKALDEAIIQVENFSLITEEGRPRLLGSEKVLQLLRYGREDLEYYLEAVKHASIVEGMLRNGNPFTMMSDEYKSELRSKTHKIACITRALKCRFESPGSTEIDARDRMSNGRELPAEHALIMQNRELDDFESGKWQERHSREGIEKQRIKRQRIIEFENQIKKIYEYQKQGEEFGDYLKKLKDDGVVFTQETGLKTDYKKIEVDVDEILDAFISHNWFREKKENESDEKYRKEARGVLGRFLRELGNPELNVVAGEHEGHEKGIFYERLFSFEVLMDTICNKDDKQLEITLKPLLEFDFQSTMEEFAYNEKSPKEIVELIPKLNNIRTQLNMRIQWANAFVKYMSPALRWRYEWARTMYNHVSMIGYHSLSPECEEYSFKYAYDTEVKNFDKNIGYYDHSTELKDISRLGLKKLKEGYNLRISNTDDAKNIAESLMKLSLVTDDGRCRLFGNESASELLDYAQEDLLYYAQYKAYGERFKEWYDNNNQAATDILGNRVKINKILERADQAGRLYNALSLRLSNAHNAVATQIIYNLENGTEDHAWYLKLQKTQFELFGGN